MGKRLKKKKVPKTSSRKSTSSKFSLYTIVLTAFFLSGITGLVYEILWTRMIEAITGTAPYAVSIVLTVFMGGLGLGSVIAGRVTDRYTHPGDLLRLYGLLELGIGAYGIILPFLLIIFRPVYKVLYNQLFEIPMVYNLLTFIGCIVLLIVPATCMGATLPILSRFYVTRDTHIGSHLGRLYGINTIGAAVGSILCGFWIIGAWGIYGALGTAIAVNTMISITSLKLSKDHRLSVSLPTENAINNVIPADHESVSAFQRMIGIIALIIFAISGFCSMAYEVIWTKLLGLIVGPTVFSFATVVAIFVLGLAFGSMLFGHIADQLAKRTSNTTSSTALLLATTQIGAAASVLVVSQILGNSQIFFSKLIYRFQHHFVMLTFSKMAILFMLLAVPTIFLGATFPLVGKLYTRSMSKIGRSVGFAYAINTIGAVLGSFSAGFILIPLLGKEQGISLLVIVQLVTALTAGIYIVFRSSSHRWMLLPLMLVAVTALGGSFYYPHWNHLMLSEGKYHRWNQLMFSGDDSFRSDRYQYNSIGWIESLFNWTGNITGNEKGELVYYGDGIGGFTTVLKYTNIFGGDEYSISNSGKADASSWNEDMLTQTLLAHFPMIFHPDPKSVMVLGLASGITAGETLYYPLERLDIIDINDQVVKASDFFIPWNNNVLDDPRTNLIIQDGRAHMQMTDRSYDVIISEPSNPWMAGLAALFTKDFFTAVNEHLNDGGIFCQWVHSYQIDWENFSLIGRTFASVFPQSVYVTTEPGSPGTDCLLIGIKGNHSLEQSSLERNSTYASRSTNMTLTDPRVLYSLILADNLAEIFEPGPLNTDNRPLLEYGAPKQMYRDDPMISQNLLSRRRLSTEFIAMIRTISNDIDLQIDTVEYLLSFNREFAGIVTIEDATPEQRERYRQIMLKYCIQNRVVDFSFIADENIREECFSNHIAAMQDSALTTSQPEVIYQHIGSLLDNQGDMQNALYYYEQAIRANPSFDSPYYNIGRIYAIQGNTTDAMEYYLKAIDRNPNNSYAYNNLGSLYARQNRYNEASRNYLASLRIDPNQPITLRNLSKIYQIQGQSRKSEKYLKKAESLEQIQGN